MSIRQHNDIKYQVLKFMADKKKYTAKQIAEAIYNPSIHSKFKSFFSSFRANLNNYQSYTHPIIKRYSAKGLGYGPGIAYIYRITATGLTRLHQMNLTNRIFGVYRLKYGNIPLLKKVDKGKYRVNPEIIPYAPRFSPTPPAVLWQLV